MTERGQRRKLVGTVVSNRMDKTVLILVERLTRHTTYKKYVRRRAKFNSASGDNLGSCPISSR